MSYVIRERGAGRIIERTITYGMLVMPGIGLHLANSRETPLPSLSDSELQQAAELVLAQAVSTWRGFEREVNGITFRYYFEFRIEPSFDVTPVREWRTTGGLPFEIEAPDTKSYRDAIREAQARGLDNIAVVHPNLYGRNATAPRVDDDGNFVSLGSYTRSLLERTSNVVTIDRVRIERSGNQTAAHEIGHTLGLGHQSRLECIMYSGDLPRSMTNAEKDNVHGSAETFAFAEGVYWQGVHLQRHLWQERRGHHPSRRAH